MKNCTHCAHAEWLKTAAGRLHPSGDGKCRKAMEWKAPPIPACSYWLDGMPTPTGCKISRRQELASHCVYWTMKDTEA